MTTTRLLVPLVAVLALVVPGATADNPPPTVLAERGKELFADDFGRTELGAKWRAGIPKVTVQDGVLVGEELPEKKHAAVAKVPMPYADIVADFDFRLDGGRAINFVMDDNTYKGSHAGHIARVAFNGAGVNLADTKTGVMANEHYENKDKPEYKEKLAAVRRATEAAARVKIEQKKWYHATVEVLGDEAVVSLDGKPVAYLKSPGLAHRTKSLLGFSLAGQVGKVDNLRVCEAKPDPNWPARRSELKARLQSAANPKN